MTAFSFARLIALLRKEIDPGPPRHDDAAHHRRACRSCSCSCSATRSIPIPSICRPACCRSRIPNTSAPSRPRCAIPAITTSACCAAEAEAERGLARGDLMFVIEVPPDFDRAVDRGEIPSVLIDADATDPTRDRQRGRRRSPRDRRRSIATCRRSARSQPQTPPFQFVLHARYNPEQLTVLNIVPGLICIVLMFSTLFVTTLADHQRARARHDGEPARHAGEADRGDDRQDRALCGHRLHPGGADPGRVGAVLRPADPRLGAAAARRRSGCSSPAIWRSA